MSYAFFFMHVGFHMLNVVNHTLYEYKSQQIINKLMYDLKKNTQTF